MIQGQGFLCMVSPQGLPFFGCTKTNLCLTDNSLEQFESHKDQEVHDDNKQSTVSFLGSSATLLQLIKHFLDLINFLGQVLPPGEG